MNSFATAKLVNLETDEDHEDEAYILGQSRVTFANNVADRIIRFQIGIRVPGEYRILISLHGKTSSPDTALHYSVQADLLTEVICVTEPVCHNLMRERSRSVVAEDGVHNDIPMAVIEAGLPSAYFRVLMEAPLTSYQRTFLVQAMAAVTANRSRPNEEPDGSIDEDEGGVLLTPEQLEKCGVIGPVGAASPIEG